MSSEAVIGLEVHAQLATRTKIFCSCPTHFGAAPNSQTCPVCLGMPGALPVLNRRAVDHALKTALATSCRLNAVSRFARKNYVYPDLPKGYQITQFDLPLAVHGFLEIETKARGVKKIGIARIHLEEDAGKRLHERDGHACGSSYIDYNRAGVPLIEIVSEPDMRLPEEAGAYLRALHAIVQYLGVCDGNMEQGNFRCDANISMRPHSAAPLGTKVEIKNMNSFRYVERAISCEITRQMELLAGGHAVVQETRQWDESSARTVSMRVKEEAHDYRYFPDPDLGPLELDADWIDRVSAQVPELPLEKRRRFIETFGLTADDADFLIRTRQAADYFEKTVALGADARQVSSWIREHMMRIINDVRDIAGCSVTPAHLAELLALIADGTISNKMAKVVFDEIVLTSQYPRSIIDINRMVQISDPAELSMIVASVLDRYTAEVKDYRGGKKKLFGFFVGMIMNATGGRAHPGLVNELLRRALDEHDY